MKAKLNSKSQAKKFSMKSKMFNSVFEVPGTKPKYLLNNIDSHVNSKETDVIYENWMSVSSPIFKNELKLPIFNYDANGVGQALTTKRDYTRINEKFQDRPTWMNSAQTFNRDPNSPKKRYDFWFRLSNSYLYYGESKNSTVILGTFDYEHDCASAIKKNLNCFELKSKDEISYEYCADSTEIMAKFLCPIQNFLRLEVDIVCKGSTQGVPQPTSSGIIKEKIITQPYILIPMSREECNEHWDYKFHGKNWECLCKEGNIILN
jgi:hypothetical protein